MIISHDATHFKVILQSSIWNATINPAIVSRLSAIKAAMWKGCIPHTGYLAVRISKHPGEDLT